MSKFEVDEAMAVASLILGVVVWLRYLEHWRRMWRLWEYLQVGRWWDGGVRSSGWWHSLANRVKGWLL